MSNPLSIRVSSLVYVDSNPHMADFRGDHWRVTLHNPRNRRQMTTYFSKGYGHNGQEPTADEVLACLVSDASGIDQDFEGWADDLGYDPETREAEKIYKAVKRQTAKLERFIGSDDDMEALQEWSNEQ